MKCRECKNEIKEDEDVFEGDLCEDCFLEKIFPESDNQDWKREERERNRK